MRTACGLKIISHLRHHPKQKLQTHSSYIIRYVHLYLFLQTLIIGNEICMSLPGWIRANLKLLHETVRSIMANIKCNELYITKHPLIRGFHIAEAQYFFGLILVSRTDFLQRNEIRQNRQVKKIATLHFTTSRPIKLFVSRPMDSVGT